MEITTDHNMLLKKFFENQEELNNLVQESNRISYCSTRREDTNYLNWQLKEDSSSFSTEKSASEDEFPIKKVCLQSAVRAVTKTHSKRDVISKQNINNKVRLRNHRILGMLQSTLQKFQDDAVKRKPQDLKRIAVELKVEAAKEDEKRRMQKEEIDLNLKIKEKKLQLDCIKQMLDITESFHVWECNMNKSLNFIITEAEPKIYYLPTSHNVSTRKKLEQSRLKMLKSIVKQEKEAMDKLAVIKDSFETGSFGSKD